MSFLSQNDEDTECSNSLGNKKEDIIGRKPLDYEGLKRQILEKNLAKIEEKQRDKMFEEYHNYRAKLEHECDKKLEMEKKIAAKQLNEYRMTMQKKRYSREYDLNDTTEADDRFHPKCDSFHDPKTKCKSAILSIVEKDYERQVAKSPLKLRQTLEKQITEKQAFKQDMKEAEKQYQEDLAVQSNIFKQCMELEQQAKRLEEIKLKEFNKLLAAQVKGKQINEKKKDDADRMAHIYNVLTSDFFMETPNAIQSALSDKKSNAQYFKGTSPEQLYAIQKERELQIKEKRIVKEEEKVNEEYFQLMDRVINQQLNHNYMQERIRKRDEAQKIMNENKLMAIDKQISSKECKKVRFRN